MFNLLNLIIFVVILKLGVTIHIKDILIKHRFRRDTVRDPARKWINGKVPFLISPDAGIRTRSAFKGAVQEIERISCVRFVPRTQETDFVKIITGDGCYSVVGRDGGQQVMSLGDGCYRKGIALHEVMHLLGFFHEQSRLDRDEHVFVNYQNADIEARRQFKQYRPMDADTLGEAYDPDSIMHYANNAFSINGSPTLVYRKDPSRKLGQRNGLSAIDIRQLNKLYSCPSNYLNETAIEKLNNETNRKPFIDRCRDNPVSLANGHCFFGKLVGNCYFAMRRMAYLCPRTCGYCRPTCIDTSPYCRHFGSYGYCISSVAVRRRCQKTCGLCTVAR